MAVSFDLTEDQRDLRDWVHTVRRRRHPPRPREWDEREESPWPSSRRPPRSASTPSTSSPPSASTRPGSGIPITMEELFWGDAGIGLSIVGTALAAAALTRQRHRRADRASGCRRCSAPPATSRSRAFCSSEPDAGSDVGAMRTRATYDEATDEWVLNGTKTWATNGGIANVHVVGGRRPRAAAPAARPPSSSRRARRASRQGQKFNKHGIRASHTAEVVLDDVPRPRLLPARRQGEARRAAGPGPRGRARAARSQPRWRTFERTRPGGRRAGRRHRPGRVRVRAGLRQDRASSSAGRSSRTRRSPSCSPT